MQTSVARFGVSLNAADNEYTFAATLASERCGRSVLCVWELRVQRANSVIKSNEHRVCTPLPSSRDFDEACCTTPIPLCLDTGDQFHNVQQPKLLLLLLPPSLPPLPPHTAYRQRAHAFTYNFCGQKHASTALCRGGVTGNGHGSSS